jgi:hypothetical protein
MIFMLFALITDSIDIDTTHVDSIKIYQVPEVFSFAMPGISEKVTFKTDRQCGPEPWHLDALDLINSTNFYPFYAGPGQWLSIGSTGRSVRNLDLYINNRRIYNPFSGYADLLWFAPGSIGKIDIDNSHGQMPSINITTPANKYECPRSSINYWGGANNTTCFSITYSRPFNDQLGIYMNGYYDYGTGEYFNSDHRIYRFYMNNYYGTLLRTDFIYYQNEFGFPGSDQDTSSNKATAELIDFGTGLGSKKNKVLLGITSFKNKQPYVNGSGTIENRFLLLAFQNRNCFSWRRLLIEYGFEVFYNSINSDLAPGTKGYRLAAANINITRDLNNFVWQLNNKLENAADGNFYIPSMTASYAIGKTIISSRVGRYTRSPAYLETSESHISFRDFYGDIVGNPLLVNEDMWGVELGIQISYLKAGFYNNYYESRIVRDEFGGLGVPGRFVNIDDQNVYGLTLNCNYNLYLKQDTTNNRSLAIIISANADHCLIDENNIGQPKTYASTGIGIRHESKRLGLALLLNGRYAGERKSAGQITEDPFFIISPIAYLRFIALSASLRIENVLDQPAEYIPGYQVPGRHIIFGFKWDFRN